MMRIVNTRPEYTVREHMYAEMMALARKDYYRLYASGMDDVAAIETAGLCVVWDEDAVELVLEHCTAKAKSAVNEVLPEDKVDATSRAMGMFNVDLALILDQEDAGNE